MFKRLFIKKGGVVEDTKIETQEGYTTHSRAYPTVMSTART